MNLDKFFASMRAAPELVGSAKLTQTQVDVASSIIDHMSRADWGVNATAYVLATAWHEAKLTPKREDMYYTTAKRIRAVWPSRFKTDAAAVGYLKQPVRLGNFVYGDRLGNRPGTNDGFVYRGGGVDQLTGRDNYQRLGIADNPDAILQPALAVASLVHGMGTGRYRTYNLADFFTATKADFVGARAIVNNDVKANGALVAKYATAFVRALNEAGYKPGVSTPSPKPSVPVTDPMYEGTVGFDNVAPVFAFGAALAAVVWYFITKG